MRLHPEDNVVSAYFLLLVVPIKEMKAITSHVGTDFLQPAKR